MAKEKKQTMSSAELSSFCGQVALILEGGLPLYDGMETLAETDKSSANAPMYEAASKGVTENGSLYQTLKEDGRWPEYLVEMVGVGERSGQLDKVMRGLEKFYAREDRIRQAITGAVTYPLVLGAMLVVIVLILLWKVLPVFHRVLGSMGMSLESSGNTLMRMGVAAGWIVLALVGLGVVGVLVTVLLMKTSWREKIVDAVGNAIPAIGRIGTSLSASRAASVLGMMLSGGFRTEEALERAAAVMTDQRAANKIDEVRKGMEAGENFADALAKTGLFQELENRMIRMGNATGREDQVLEKIGEMYEERTEQDIATMIGIIEPTLVALLCIVIGAVLLSVMLPMAGMLSAL